MTAGSNIRDFTSPYNMYHQDIGGYSYSTGVGRLGRKTTKTWNGGDDPPTRPEYTTVSYVLPYFNQKGKRKYRVVKRRLRVGAMTRVKRLDHNYTMTVIYEENLPYTQRTSEYVYDGTKWFYRPTDLDVSLSRETFGTSFDVTGLWDSNDDIALLGRLRNQIAGSDFNAGIVLAEMHKSLGMIANAAIRIRKSIKSLLKGDVKRAARELGVEYRGRKRGSKEASRTIADQWLEISYGWVPLVNDAKSGAEFLAHLFNLPLNQTYRARLKKAHVITKLQTFNEHKVVSYETGQIIARISEVDVVTLAGLTDGASMLHENTPWSFVADWFIPIGNYLSARGLARSVKGTFVTTKTWYQYEHYSGLPTKYGYPYMWEALEGPDKTRYARTVSRSVSNSLGVPLPRFKPLGDVPSWKRAANAVALLTQKLF